MEDDKEIEKEDSRAEMISKILQTLPENTEAFILCYQIGPEYYGETLIGGNIEAAQNMARKIPEEVDELIDGGFAAAQELIDEINQDDEDDD